MAVINYAKPARDCIDDGRPTGKDHVPNPKGKVQRLPFGHDPEAEDSDYRDKMTRDELAGNDHEMAKIAIRDSRAYYFDLKFDLRTGLLDIRVPMAFIGRCIQMTHNRCGIMILEGMDERTIKKLLKKSNVQTETRDFYKGENMWRNGVYIFKDGELAAFISTP